MKLATIIACWIGLLVVGVYLRIDHLPSRPFHSDEATGARITANRMQSGDYQFDPVHFHGPLLSSLAMTFCKAHGETSWKTMTAGTLRSLPAVAGCLLIIVPLLARRRLGDGPALLAAAFFTTSPLLVYYNRMFIHESLLVLFGMLALVSLLYKPRWGVSGILIGLMFATRETFVISIIVWAAAGVMVAIENRGQFDRRRMGMIWRQFRIPVLLSLVTALLTATWFYTDGFHHPRGALDAVRTYFVYTTTEGHEKPFIYYLQFLLIPHKTAGVWWFETPVLIFALLAYAGTFRRSPEAANQRATVRFLSYAAAGHFLIYSLLSYKTPWLACMPWAHVCLLAGFGAAAFARFRLPAKLACALCVCLALASQAIVTRHATGRLAADARNPYAYVPTSQDIETLDPWLHELGATSPDMPLEPVAVIGSGYWPLPWYLRSFDKIGYWPTPPENLPRYPLVFAVPDSLDAVMDKLADTHTPVPRGLRSEVPLTLFIRNDIWQHWMHAERK